MPASASAIRAGRAFVELFADDSQMVRVLKSAEKRLKNFGSEGWQIWSPDGSRIAFQSYDQGNARLVIMPVPDTAGTESDGTAVTTTPFWSGAPGRLGYTWAPDGSAMVLVDFYVRPADATTFLVDAATGELQAMDWKTDGWPSWQYGTSR
jgi:Tol biopolymer transport system component